MDELKQGASGGGGTPSEEAWLSRLLERAGPRPEVPAADLEAIRSAFRSEWRRYLDRRRRQRIAWRILPLAAAVVVALGAGWWWWRLGPPSGEAEGPATVEVVVGQVTVRHPDAGPASPATLLKVGETIPVGGVLETAADPGQAAARAALRLPGGASLRIDVDSRVRLASAAAVELERGALYVDTEDRARKDAAIEIHTALGVARDLGTRFEVRLLQGEVGALRVRVREGAVQVEGQDASYSTGGGSELILRADGSIARSPVAPHSPAWAWVLETAPRLDIEGRTLRELLDWVGRETGWEIRFAEEGLEAAAGSTVLHGTLGDLTPDQAPALVLPGAGLRHQVVDGVLTVDTAEGGAGL